MKKKTSEVEAYFQALAPERRSALEELRSLILEAAPDGVETMRYRMPTNAVNLRTEALGTII
jgi:uncharacterized protein YdhG (YjbR/CyaY superfamily)